MASTSRRTTSPRDVSLLHLNQLIDELEFLTGTFTEAATPTVLALVKQISHAGREHFELFQRGDTQSEIQAFEAMFQRHLAAKAAAHAAIAREKTQQVSAGAKAGQVTSRKEAQRPVAAGAAAAPTSLPVVTAGAIAELQSNQAAIVASIADLQKNQAEAARTGIVHRQRRIVRRQRPLCSASRPAWQSQPPQ